MGFNSGFKGLKILKFGNVLYKTYPSYQVKIQYKVLIQFRTFSNHIYLSMAMLNCNTTLQYRYVSTTYKNTCMHTHTHTHTHTSYNILVVSVPSQSEHVSLSV